MEKQLTTEESIALISRMIAGARQNFNNTGGAMFLIWGYTTIAATIAVLVSFAFTKSYDTMWIWWAIPLVGGVLTRRHFSRVERRVTTQIDKAVMSVWLSAFVATLSCMVFAFLPAGVLPTSDFRFPVLFVIGLTIGMSTAVTGLIIRFRPVAIGGFAGIVMSFVLLLLSGMTPQLIAFAVMFLLVQVIPGHLLDRACRKEIRESDCLGALGYGASDR